MFRRMFMKKKAPKRMPLATITNELFLPTRMVYEVYDARRLNSWLVNTSCMAWDERLERWVWLHCDAALDLDFAQIRQSAEEKPPCGIGHLLSGRRPDLPRLHPCGLRAAKFLTFFDRAVLRTVAMASSSIINLVTIWNRARCLPFEDYFRTRTRFISSIWPP